MSPSSPTGSVPGSLARRVGQPGRNPAIQLLFLVNVVAFISLNTVLLVLNLIVSRDVLWFPYVVWGWAIVLVLHGAWAWPGRALVGWHAALFVVVNAGLVAINVHTGGPPWILWTIAVPGILLLDHWLIAGRGISAMRAHLLTTALLTPVVGLIPIASGDASVSVFPILVELWALVAIHWLARHRMLSSFGMQVLLYAGVIGPLALHNAITQPDFWWVLYPAAIWGVLVVVYGIAAYARMPGTDATVLNTVIAALADRRSPVWPRRVLAAHAALFAVVSATMMVADLVDGPSRWAGWPVLAWLVLLIVHAGAVLMPAGMFGAHLFAWLAGSAALVAIDSSTDGGPWWRWPVMWWGVIVAGHAGAALVPGQRLLAMHAFGGAALSVALYLTNRMTGPPTWWWYPVGAVIFTLLLHLGWKFAQRVYSRLPSGAG